MAKVHVSIPFTTQVACGEAGYYSTALCRESVTCRSCRKTDEFKKLRNAPARFRKTKREARA